VITLSVASPAQNLVHASASDGTLRAGGLAAQQPARKAPTRACPVAAAQRTLRSADFVSDMVDWMTSKRGHGGGIDERSPGHYHLRWRPGHGACPLLGNADARWSVR
jgi:hypothetical protein